MSLGARGRFVALFAVASVGCGDDGAGSVAARCARLDVAACRQESACVTIVAQRFSTTNACESSAGTEVGCLERGTICTEAISYALDPAGHVWVFGDGCHPTGWTSLTQSEASARATNAACEPDASSGASTLLPSTTKGYELYAWQEGSELRFTLVTGTNRPKTADEIAGLSADVLDGEWVLIRGRGLGSLEHTMERVPVRTSVVFVSPAELTPLSVADRSAVERLLAAFQAPFE